MCIGSFPMLFLNEGRSVHRVQAIHEGREVVVENVGADSVDPHDESKLVHVTGFAETDQWITDPKTDVTVENTLRLQRTVEMFQWHQRGSREKAKYELEWSEDAESVDDPARDNQPFPFKSKTFDAEPIRVGERMLSERLVGMIRNFQPLADPGTVEQLPESLRGRAHLRPGGYFVGLNPLAPAPGDLKIQYAVALPTKVSILSRQTADSFQAYSTETVKGSIERLETGTHSASEMFDSMVTENTILTWVLRFGGWFVMFMGGMFVLSPLQSMLGYIPLLGRMANSVIGVAVFLVTAALALTVIAVAWIFYRPLLGIALLAIAAVLIGGAVWISRRRQDVSDEVTMVTETV